MNNTYIVIDEEGDPWAFSTPELALAFADALWSGSGAEMMHVCPINTTMPEGFA